MTPELEDQLSALLRRAIAGDETAYAGFLRQVSGIVRAFARRRCGPGLGVDAEDIVQEALLAIHTKRHTWEPSAPVGPWVYAIARHKLIDAFRRRGQRVHIDIDEVADTLASEQAEIGEDRAIAKAIAGLTGGQRSVVESVSIEGRSIRETADALGMKETAVRVALHRGLAAIASRFGKTP